jgi:pyruvate formate lyase activating enzyme
LITSEWAVEIFKLAIDSGIKCAFVSNGNATTEALEYLHPYLTALKIDLKSMQERNYRELGGVLKNVLDTIQKAYLMGIWVEVVTLVIPGYNDSNDELWEAARYLSSVSPDIPWHVTAFHPDYQMQAVQPTPVDTLKRAAEIGQEAGLRYVYAGNLPGKVGTMEDTHCPNCQSVLVKRKGYIILAYNISANGTCPDCGTSISGVWTDRPETVKTGGWGMPKEIW